MPVVPAFDDETRLKVLNVLLDKGAIRPDVPKIMKITGLDILSVKKALRWLEEEVGVESYYPRVPSRKVGYNTKAMIFFQLDRTKKDSFDDLIRFLEKEPTIISAHKIIGSGKWNFAIRLVAKNLEKFDSLVNEKLLMSIRESKDFILDKHYVFFGEPSFEPKSNKRGLALINTSIQKSIQRGVLEKVLPSEQYKLKVFDCFSSGDCLKANMRFIQKKTGLHASTIKASLKFLFDQGVIEAYAPTINFEKSRDKFYVFDFMKIDFNNSEKINVLKGIIENDPNVFQARHYFGDENYNFVFLQVYDTIENYEKEFNNKYIANPELNGFITKGTTYFTLTHPFEKREIWPSKSATLIKSITSDSGRDLGLEGHKKPNPINNEKEQNPSIV